MLISASHLLDKCTLVGIVASVSVVALLLVLTINALIQKTLWTVKWTVLYSSVAVSGRTKTILERPLTECHVQDTIELLQ